MPHWHHTQKAQAILSPASIDDLHVAKRIRIVGPDYLAIEGEPRTALDALRTRWIERRIGKFSDCPTEAARKVYIDYFNTIPDADDVLNAHFGDPNAWTGCGEQEAGRQWRAAYLAGLAERIAA